MRVESLNVGRAEEMRLGARTIVTGIDKKPVERVRVARLGLDGDTIGDLEHHGGADQAVYVYSREDYAHWEAELGASLAGGSFGENVTVSSFGPGELRVGDRLQLGDVLLELTGPRIPCATFATHMGEHDWVRRFRAARLLGAYCRVLVEGELEVGAAVERRPAAETAPTLLEVADVFYDTDAPVDALVRLLDAPIDERGRAHFEARLAAFRAA